MLAHFANREKWSALNSKLEEALKLDAPRSSARLYQGLHHALMEVVMGLARQYPLKKSIYYWKGVDPFIEPVAMAMAREGYQLQALKEEQILNPDDWIQEVGKETLMVIYPEDDPLLGILHPVEKLEEAFKSIRAFQVKVSHHAFRFREWPKALEKFQIEMYAVRRNLTLTLSGERARFGDWMSEGLIWQESELEAVASLRPVPELNPEKILNFEKHLPQGFTPFFKNSRRIMDRSVFYSEDLDGHAVIESLAQLHKVALLPAGEETRYETASLSRWGGLRTMDWLYKFGLQPNQLRGLVILSDDAVTPDIIEELAWVRADLLRLQGM